MSRVENGDSIIKLLGSKPAYKVDVYMTGGLYYAHVTRKKDGVGRLYFARTPGELMDADVAGFMGGYDE